jgi:hypothetical protein
MPLTIYIVRFMGGQDLFPGSVSGVKDGRVALDLGRIRGARFGAADGLYR